MLVAWCGAMKCPGAGVLVYRLAGILVAWCGAMWCRGVMVWCCGIDVGVGGFVSCRVVWCRDMVLVLLVLCRDTVLVLLVLCRIMLCHFMSCYFVVLMVCVML